MAHRNTTIRDRHRELIARSRPPCALCGQPIDYSLKRPNPMCFVVDHIVPLDKGGPDVIANKQPAHWKCNDDKRTSSEVRAVLNRAASIARPHPTGGTHTRPSSAPPV